MKKNKLSQFFKEDLWRVTHDDVKTGKRVLYNILRTIILSVRGFIDKDLNIRANGLTYSLMFAIVPILAMVLAIAKGFGFENMIESKLNDSFLGEMNMVPTIMGFVERYLDTTQGGIFIGVGLLILIWAVYLFFRNVEMTFNGIWNVRQSRSVGRQLTNYIFILFMIPILIVVSSGLTVFLNSTASWLAEFESMRYFNRFFVKVAPFIVAWFIFTWMYCVIPNTKVKFLSGFIPGVICGTLFQLLQMLSVYIIMFLGRTSVVYGAFASIPILLMWLQWSCLLMLTGAEMSYAIQNKEEFEYESDMLTMSRRYKDYIMLYLLMIIVRRFENEELPLTAHELAYEHHLPTRLVTRLLSRLEDTGIVREVYVEGKEERTFQPALDIHKISVGMVIDRIEGQGSELFLRNAPKPMQLFWKQYMQLKNDRVDLHDVMLVEWEKRIQKP